MGFHFICFGFDFGFSFGFSFSFSFIRAVFLRIRWKFGAKLSVSQKVSSMQVSAQIFTFIQRPSAPLTYILLSSSASNYWATLDSDSVVKTDTCPRFSAQVGRRRGSAQLGSAYLSLEFGLAVAAPYRQRKSTLRARITLQSQLLVRTHFNAVNYH